MDTIQLQKKIIELKKEKDVCILAHAYQTHNILEIADFVGDSFALSQKAQSVSQKTLLMCGVRFMAETAKLLSPDKKVILSHPDAGCPMAEMLNAEQLRELKKKCPDHAVVAYINTTSELKAECDVCVTSASALDIVRGLDEKNILFVPDRNLGTWLAEQLPEKNFCFIDGCCPIHTRLTAADVHTARAKHPEAKLLVHPECKKEVSELADYVGSTTGIMKYARQSENKEFIIGTDNSIVEHLQYESPEKVFYPLSKKCVCEDMRLTTLSDVYRCLIGEGGEEIVLDEGLEKKAVQCIDRMLSMTK